MVGDKYIIPGNTMLLDIPGLDETLKIPFPSRRLPVCAKCKGHFKTRDLCRSRKMHTALPWTFVNICVSIDKSCLNEDSTLRKGPYKVRNIDWQPYEIKKSVKLEDDLSMCLDCKNKNYTASFCRGGANYHRYLPWNTVYMELSCPNQSVTNVKRESSQVDESCDKDILSSKKTEKEKNSETDDSSEHERRDGTDSEDGSKNRTRKTSDAQILPRKKKKYETQNNVDDESIDEEFDITKIDKSRAFLVKVSHESMSLMWLDYDEKKAVTYSTELKARTNAKQRESSGSRESSASTRFNENKTFDSERYPSQYYNHSMQHYRHVFPHSYSYQNPGIQHPFHRDTISTVPPLNQYRSNYGSVNNYILQNPHQGNIPMESSGNGVNNWNQHYRQWMSQHQTWIPYSRQPWQDYSSYEALHNQHYPVHRNREEDSLTGSRIDSESYHHEDGNYYTSNHQHQSMRHYENGYQQGSSYENNEPRQQSHHPNHHNPYD